MMATAHTAPWQERLYIPAYRVGEAARYARTSAKTAADWQRLRGNRTNVLSPRMRGSGLSYLQLIELGVVAAMRKSGVPLSKVRQAREYLAGQLETDFPFAQYRFKTDGKSLFLDYEQVEGHSEVQKLLALNKQGQFEWSEIIDDLLREFEYDDETVLRWNVAGLGSPIVIDPRIAFGKPQVNGIPTWVLKERWRQTPPVRKAVSPAWNWTAGSVEPL